MSKDSEKYIIIDGVLYEIHADGIKEVCPFCAPGPFCEEPHCPYTEEE